VHQPVQERASRHDDGPRSNGLSVLERQADDTPVLHDDAAGRCEDPTDICCMVDRLPYPVSVGAFVRLRTR
jgi:hypothetical protein